MAKKDGKRRNSSNKYSIQDDIIVAGMHFTAMFIFKLIIYNV